MSYEYPYYSFCGIDIYLGDSRELLNGIDGYNNIITDPTWPNSKSDILGKDDPFGMLKDVISQVNKVDRAAIHLGADSDPRILTAVPDYLGFFRQVNLEYVFPHPKGRVLYTHDAIYLFGDPPKSKKGQHLIPGRYTSTDAAGKESTHPCPRKLQHVKWIVKWFSEKTDVILDPFMGSGTTLVAARIMGRRAIGIEFEKKFCDEAIKRIESINEFDFEKWKNR